MTTQAGLGSNPTLEKCLQEWNVYETFTKHGELHVEEAKHCLVGLICSMAKEIVKLFSFDINAYSTSKQRTRNAKASRIPIDTLFRDELNPKSTALLFFFSKVIFPHLDDDATYKESIYSIAGKKGSSWKSIGKQVELVMKTSAIDHMKETGRSGTQLSKYIKALVSTGDWMVTHTFEVEMEVLSRLRDSLYVDMKITQSRVAVASSNGVSDGEAIQTLTSNNHESYTSPTKIIAPNKESDDESTNEPDDEPYKSPTIPNIPSNKESDDESNNESDDESYNPPTTPNIPSNNESDDESNHESDDESNNESDEKPLTTLIVLSSDESDNESYDEVDASFNNEADDESFMATTASANTTTKMNKRKHIGEQEGVKPKRLKGGARKMKVGHWYMQCPYCDPLDPKVYRREFPITLADSFRKMPGSTNLIDPKQDIPQTFIDMCVEEGTDYITGLKDSNGDRTFGFLYEYRRHIKEEHPGLLDNFDAEGCECVYPLFRKKPLKHNYPADLKRKPKDNSEKKELAKQRCNHATKMRRRANKERSMEMEAEIAALADAKQENEAEILRLACDKKEMVAEIKDLAREMGSWLASGENADSATIRGWTGRLHDVL